MSRLVFAFMWLLHFLPLRLVAAAGNAIGMLLFWIIHERREVVRTNLRLCFPQMAGAERERLARAHFRAFCRSFLERGILWWGSPARLRRLIQVEGAEHLERLRGKPVILFAPHFVALDAGLLRLTMEHPVAGIYSRQKDRLFERLLTRGRTRFGGQGFTRDDGLRASLRPLRQGSLYYYLPDLDYGPKRALFVPFFGVPAATVTGMSEIARLTGATVVPCVTRMLPGGGGYVARLYPPWSDFPAGRDDAAAFADTRRMLAFVEERVLEMPEQYYWLHKRFKTRPPGELRFYR